MDAVQERDQTVPPQYAAIVAALDRMCGHEVTIRVDSDDVGAVMTGVLRRRTSYEGRRALRFVEFEVCGPAGDLVGVMVRDDPPYRHWFADERCERWVMWQVDDPRERFDVSLVGEPEVA